MTANSPSSPPKEIAYSDDNDSLQEIAQIKNVKGVNPITGDYSYEENGRGYLYIDGILLEKEEPALDIVSVGEIRLCVVWLWAL